MSDRKFYLTALLLMFGLMILIGWKLCELIQALGWHRGVFADRDPDTMCFVAGLGIGFLFMIGSFVKWLYEIERLAARARALRKLKEAPSGA